MPIDVSRPDLTLAVIGTGVMGRGIAQIAAQAGIRTLLHDSRPGAAREAKDTLLQQLSRLAEKGRLDRDAVARAEASLVIADSPAALSPCHIVIEAIVENLDAKRELFHALETIVAEDCLLATNTSSLSVTAIAAACKRPERVGGFHFFNPVPLMKVVEVVDGLLTAPWVGEALTALALRCGHTPVRAKDTPGFIVNHAGRGYGTEALRILGEGIAEFHDVDRILRDCAGFRMGPFELFDLTGLDVSHPVMESIYRQYYEEPRFRPSPLTGQRLNAGLLGRKSGRGFYRHENGRQEEIAEPPAPAARPAGVWVSRAGLGAKLVELLRKLGAHIDPGAHTRDARGGARAARERRRADVGDPRLARIRRAARHRPDRQRRLRHRAAAHRLARGHRRGGRARPRLSAGTARLGRCDRPGEDSHDSRRPARFLRRPPVSRESLAQAPRPARRIIADGRSLKPVSGDFA